MFRPTPRLLFLGFSACLTGASLVVTAADPAPSTPKPVPNRIRDGVQRSIDPYSAPQSPGYTREDRINDVDITPVAPPILFRAPRSKQGQEEDAHGDQSHSWIFSSPESVQEQSLERVLKSRATVGEANEKKISGIKKALDPRRETDNASSLTPNSSSDERLDLGGSDKLRDRDRDRDRLNFKLTSPDGALAAPSGSRIPGSLLRGDRVNRPDAVHDRQSEMMSQFKQLLEPRGNPFSQNAGLNNPLNSAQDNTRSSVNPIMSPNSDPFYRAPRTDFSDSWQKSQLPLNGPRSPFLEDANSRVLGIYQNNLLKPADPVVARPQPAVLPFPKRVF
jgi:hypothetical protein